MGVYIKNMEIPKSCFECKLLDYTDTFKCRFRFESLAREHGINISRPSWCPLVPVPPHGDLIDRDPFIEFIKTHWNSYGQWFVKQLKARPTIIPAEEGE